MGPRIPEARCNLAARGAGAAAAHSNGWTAPRESRIGVPLGMALVGHPPPGGAMTRQYIIAAIIALIIVTSLGIPPAIAIAIALTGVIVILMMACEGWP
jgi:hypothetical protein